MPTPLDYAKPTARGGFPWWTVASVTFVGLACLALVLGSIAAWRVQSTGGALCLIFVAGFLAVVEWRAALSADSHAAKFLAYFYTLSLVLTWLVALLAASTVRWPRYVGDYVELLVWTIVVAGMTFAFITHIWWYEGEEDAWEE